VFQSQKNTTQRSNQSKLKINRDRLLKQTKNKTQRNKTMVYISSDGTVGGTKTIWTRIRDIVNDIISLIGLFFTTVQNPRAIEANRRNRSSSTLSSSNNNNNNNGQQPPSRNQRPGANIRGVKNLSSTANCAVAGG
jgi:Selenoprotein SelK_SelG